MVSAKKQTAEGVKSSAALLALAHRYGVEMPITEVVVDVIRGRINVTQAADRLLARAPKPERYEPVISGPAG
ncbi:oxidoreductase subunit [Streptomyces violascens]|uniref:oxidoreductase subunit n=1 Tax=Streptomyces violascens TaxID=67381 RepID=UPI0036785558